MELTLAIPAHNDAGPLARLLARWAGLGVPAQVVVVDDGSQPPLEAAALARAAGLAPERLTLLRHETARGPGAARNRALAEAATELILFMDADDLPTRELPHLLADLAGRSFDFCLFQHHDTRAESFWHWGQMPQDQRLWQEAGCALGALSPVSERAAALLAQTANYPWNKIYRTGFLRGRGIGCSELLVHEDVELHWMSFLHARTILASDRTGVVHFVAPDGTRLTNRDGAERLAVFGPLARIAAATAAGHPDYALPFLRFALGLCLWISGNLHARHQGAFAAALARFLAKDAPPGALARLRAAEPGLLARIEALAETGKEPQ